MKWITVWKIERWGSMIPEQVRVLPISDGYVLEEGKEHTTYKGNFFPTPEAAFKYVQDEIDRSRRSDEDHQKRLDRARARFEKGAAA